MIGYDELATYAPPASSKEERDEWFADNEFNIDDLLRVGREVAEFKVQSLVDGDELSAEELVKTMMTAFLFGFELAVRLERDDPPDLTPPVSNGNGQ